MIRRRASRTIHVGSVTVGGAARVIVQSMTRTDTRDVRATIAQIERLADSGCEIVRLAVPDNEAAAALGEIKRRVPIPLIADIHFDYRLALAAMRENIDQVRFNPGNIRQPQDIAAIVHLAKERSIPLRIGINAGSLPRGRERGSPVDGQDARPTRLWTLDSKGGSEGLQLTGKMPVLSDSGLSTGNGGLQTPDSRLSTELRPLASRMVETALEQIRFIENLDFDLIEVSLKASSVLATIEANKAVAEMMPYPIHLGITEAGLPKSGAIRSAVGLGVLLHLGIGDSLRISLTTPDPCEEVFVAYQILKSLDLRQRGPTLVSCPTCGRCEVEGFYELAGVVEERLSLIQKSITVAVMGCVVNGPGEARDADVGLACSKGRGVIFKKGKKIRTVEEADFLNALMAEVEDFVVKSWTI
ncbi:MAG: flavodoxin-dependent (E)-4-hydroxy-3-methylbut-2-enyl-diphosphate synthase [Dehalococcoidia bacterium]|nr:4-hydroxy-3-methylbut-2-en-1-yl diphosphate synthase (flavodoxin) [Chloroflexota bacterium]